MPDEKFDYQRYLASREWAVLRERVRERSENHCERCFMFPQAAVHHLTYERVGHEDLEDLQAVCSFCHAFESGKSDFDPNAFSYDLFIYLWGSPNISHDWIGPALSALKEQTGDRAGEVLALLLSRFNIDAAIRRKHAADQEKYHNKLAGDFHYMGIELDERRLMLGERVVRYSADGSEVVYDGLDDLPRFREGNKKRGSD